MPSAFADSAAQTSPEILVADDEQSIREGLGALLESEGYRVRMASDGVEALRMCEERRPDLLLLDVMMPCLGGYAVCERLRRSDASLPIVFLTAKDSDVDELRGLSAGADDYIPKTAPEAIKLARIAAVLRRAAYAAPVSFMFGSRRVDAAQMRIVAQDGSSCDVSQRELAILRFLISHPGEVFSRDFLLTKFWGVDFDGGDSALTVALHRLREKLGGDATLLETVARQGYRYSPVR